MISHKPARGWRRGQALTHTDSAAEVCGGWGRADSVKQFSHLLYKRLLEQWNERICPWNVNVNLKCQFVLLRSYFLRIWESKGVRMRVKFSLERTLEGFRNLPVHVEYIPMTATAN